MIVKQDGKSFRWDILLAVILISSLISACALSGRQATSSPAQSLDILLAHNTITPQTKKVRVTIFATAQEVKLVVGNAVRVSADGAVGVSIDTSYRPAHPTFVPPPPYDVASLTKREIQLLRQSVFFTKPPSQPSFDDCMTLPYTATAFLFYNKSGRYLGNLWICGDNADLTPKPPANNLLPTLNWYGKVVEEILEAHNLAQPAGRGDVGAGVQRVPAHIFANAVTVKAYVGPYLSVARDGTVTSSRDMIESGGPVPRADTAQLTGQEVSQLLGSFYFTQLPETASPCICDYRHVFTFFDRSGSYLGSVALCFECGCANFIPEPRNPTGLPVLNWDEAALMRIFDAHHLEI